ncbi:MAG: AraC family transcriptional regulator [Bacteroidota bacterium]
MPLVSSILHTDFSTPPDHILGEYASIMTRERLAVNEFVHVEWQQVNFSDNKIPEEHARLLLFPIDDNKFCLQIAYIQPAEDEELNTKVCWLQFLPRFFELYPADKLMGDQPFRFDQTTEQQFSICVQTRDLLIQLQKTSAISPFIQSLQQTELTIHLLRRALECIMLPFTVCPVPACRFLVYESEREKIAEARRILEDNFEQPITIKELSRKVAMNECYLKKGFKTIVGKTIHEFQQDLRITKAKEMLREQRQTVSDVAGKLGYSSISHFSTAFKKATGMKPCELLR